jgi:hypothetical protein
MVKGSTAPSSITTRSRQAAAAGLGAGGASRAPTTPKSKSVAKALGSSAQAAGSLSRSSGAGAGSEPAAKRRRVGLQSSARVVQSRPSTRAKQTLMLTALTRAIKVELVTINDDSSIISFGRAVRVLAHYRDWIPLLLCRKEFYETISEEKGRYLNTIRKRALALYPLAAAAAEVTPVPRPRMRHAFVLLSQMESVQLGKCNLLHHALRDGATDRVRQLVELGMNVNALTRTRQPTYPLLLTNSDRKPQSKLIVELLLDHGAAVNCSGSKGLTPLMHFARYRGTQETVQILLKRGASVKQLDGRGNTALHHAVSGDLESIQLLLAAGADITKRNNAKETPLDVAEDSPDAHSGAAALLEAAAKEPSKVHGLLSQ